MPSQLITASSPTGVNFRPIQSAGTRAALTVGPLDMNPAWQANQAVFQSLQIQEQKYQFDENMKLKMAEEQRKMFQNGLSGLKNSAGIRDENYGLDPLLARHAKKISEIKQAEMATMQRMQQAFSQASGRSGRPSVDGYMREVEGAANELQVRLLNDTEYAQMALEQRRREDFAAQVAAMEKKGLGVNYNMVNKAMREYEDYANDPTGMKAFNPEVLSPQNYVFDRKVASEALTSIFTNVAKDYSFDKLLEARSEYPGMDADALMTLRTTEQRSKADAIKAATQAIRSDANLMRTLEADGTTNVEEYVAGRVEALFRHDDFRVLEQVLNVNDVNAAARIQQTADANMEKSRFDAAARLRLEQEKTTQRQVSADSRANAINRDKEPELADLYDYLSTELDGKLPSNQQARDILNMLEQAGKPASAFTYVQDANGHLIVTNIDSGKARDYGKITAAAGGGTVKVPKFTPQKKTYDELQLNETGLQLKGAIMQQEGTTEEDAKRNGYASPYDIVLGYGKFTPQGFDKPITSMTLGELDKFQSAMAKMPGNKFSNGKGGTSYSTAVGPYQITQQTLTGLKKELGLADDIQFTHEVQDRLFAALLERRGLSAFEQGQMTPEQFQLSLSREWTSLADPNTGQTYTGADTRGSGNVTTASTAPAKTSAPAPATKLDDFSVRLMDNPKSITPTMLADRAEKVLLSLPGTTKRTTSMVPGGVPSSAIEDPESKNPVAILVRERRQAQAALDKAEKAVDVAAIERAKTKLADVETRMANNEDVRKSVAMASIPAAAYQEAAEATAASWFGAAARGDSNNFELTNDAGKAVRFAIVRKSDGSYGVKITEPGKDPYTKNFSGKAGVGKQDFGKFLAQRFKGQLTDGALNRLRTKGTTAPKTNPANTATAPMEEINTMFKTAPKVGQ